MLVEGVIFDLDGTLLDSMSVWNTVGDQYIRSQGIIPHEDLSETFKTMSLQQAAEYYQTVYGLKKSMEEIVAGIDKILEHFYREKVQLKEGMREILEYFANENVKMCIATANDKCLVENALQRLEIREYFTDILTCEEVGVGKESPIIYEKALECMNTKKENTVVFEDAIHAIKTVKENGFTVVGVYEESEPDQETVKRISDYYIKQREFFE